MTAIEATATAVAVVLGLGIALMIGVIGLKWAHRKRVLAHEQRRKSYTKLIASHLAEGEATPRLADRELSDDAFIDAVIDVRNIVAAPEVDTLNGLVDSRNLVRIQAERLRDPFPLGRRLRAAVSLAEIGDQRAARVLMQHLGDKEPEIRIQCARGLSRIRHTAAIAPILNRINQEIPAVRSNFADSLIGYGPVASWPLTAFVRDHHTDPDTTGVPEVARAIGQIGDLEVGPALAELIHSIENVEVCLAVIESLGEIGGPLALRPLRKMFVSSDWRIRAKTATALGNIGDPSVDPILFTGLSDRSWWVRRNSAAALAILPGGINWLYDGLISHDEFARDAAAEALADSGELEAARVRFEAENARPRDTRLINHMNQPGLVLS